MAAQINALLHRGGGNVVNAPAISFSLQVIGSGFGNAPGGSGTVEIVENSNDTGTKVAQHVMSWSDTRIEIATDPDTLFTELQTGTLAAYLFVTGADASRSGAWPITMQWAPLTTPDDEQLRNRYVRVFRSRVELAKVRYAIVGDRTASELYDDIQAAYATALTRINSLPDDGPDGMPPDTMPRSYGLSWLRRLVTHGGLNSNLIRDVLNGPFASPAGAPLSDFLSDQRATNAEYLAGTIDLGEWLDDTQTNAVAAGISTFNASTAGILKASRISPAI